MLTRHETQAYFRLKGTYKLEKALTYLSNHEDKTYFLFNFIDIQEFGVGKNFFERN